MSEKKKNRPPFTKEEAKEYGRMGGIASGISRREKVNLNIRMADRLLKKIKDPRQKAMIDKIGISDSKDSQWADFLLDAVLQRMIKNGTMKDLAELGKFIGEDIDDIAPGEDIKDDALSESLKQLAEEIESDDK